jgi:IS5 family transposase
MLTNGYAGKPNRDFLALNKIADGIMRKDSSTAKLTEYEIERNKKLSKIRYIVCPVVIQQLYPSQPKMMFRV